MSRGHHRRGAELDQLIPRLKPVPYPGCPTCTAAEINATTSTTPGAQARYYQTIAQHPHRRADDDKGGSPEEPPNPVAGGPYPGSPYEDSPEGWWTPYGGALDPTSGVVRLPPGAKHPPCTIPECKRCADRNTNA
ncbi:hypothetical protein ACFU7T_19090 [Streptomyces sp. NPDC057555]|uniref:hypothetical protein n=1 Tax=Streptomyces sp. NPDC057555 TaxID=3346166 RepID=UPI003692E5E6